MSVLRFPTRQARIVEAKVIPWQPGIPGIWFKYSDGLEIISDATLKTQDIRRAIGLLPAADRERMEATCALDRS